MGIIEDLENGIDVVDLVGKYASLKKAGANYKALCPFPGHNEKTPSFVVSPAKQMAYCFGCHKGGGPLKFIMDIENCEFKEATQILGNITGIQVNMNIDPEKIEIQKNLYALYKDTVNYYKQALNNYPEIKKYLLDRGIQSESFSKFHFGYADSGSALYSYLKEKGYDNQLIEDSMIFNSVSMKKDKFINRVIFPIQNLRGDFVALAGRTISNQEPKYLNSPATKIYDKSAILYGLYEARTTVTKEDFIIITEGYMDTIALHEAGFLNTVAVSGTALTDKHLPIIKRLTKKVYLCFDGDGAGEKATKLSLEKMKNTGLEVRIISLPTGKDPDDIIKSGEDFKDYIDNALSPIGYYIKKSNFNLTSIEDKKKLLGELLEITKSYSDNVEKDFYLKEISKLLDINEKIIYDSFNRIKFSSEEKTNKPEKRKISSEDLAIAYIIYNPENARLLEELILFPGGIGKNLIGAIDDVTTLLGSLDLDSKEYLRGLALKIEEEHQKRNQENEADTIKKLAAGLNRESYKLLSEQLKNKMNMGDNSALTDYSELIKTAKKNGIK